MTLNSNEEQRLAMDQLCNAVDAMKLLYDNLKVVPDALGVILQLSPAHNEEALQQIKDLANSVRNLQNQAHFIVKELAELGDILSPGQNFSERIHFKKENEQ